MQNAASSQNHRIDDPHNDADDNADDAQDHAGFLLAVSGTLFLCQHCQNDGNDAADDAGDRNADANQRDNAQNQGSSCCSIFLHPLFPDII